MTANQSDQGVNPEPVVLAIETSCDETAVAITRGAEKVLANEIASQIELHRPFGGVVPEVASRNHNLVLTPLIKQALDSAHLSLKDIDAIAATAGPGLASSLLIGNTTGKALAVALQRPFYSINHLEGHLLSPFLGTDSGVRPCVSLIVSGGHTMLVQLKSIGDYELLGRTRDDAAGEAFDKVGKMLGLTYPGGPEIDRLAVGGNGKAFDFPRSMIGSGDFAFSFSGLKTSVRYLLPKLSGPLEQHLPDICASFQLAVCDVLVKKTLKAAEHCGENLITVSGGVSCNRGLRAAFKKSCKDKGYELQLAEGDLCTDNAAMIAYVAAAKLAIGEPPSNLDEDINPNLSLAS